MSALLALAAPLLLAAAPADALPACPAGQERFWFGWESACVLPGRLPLVPACRSGEDSEQGGDPGSLCPYTRFELRAEANRARREVELRAGGGAPRHSCILQPGGECPAPRPAAPAQASTPGDGNCTRRETRVDGRVEWILSCGDPERARESEALVQQALHP